MTDDINDSITVYPTKRLRFKADDEGNVQSRIYVHVSSKVYSFMNKEGNLYFCIRCWTARNVRTIAVLKPNGLHSPKIHLCDVKKTDIKKEMPAAAADTVKSNSNEKSSKLSADGNNSSKVSKNGRNSAISQLRRRIRTRSMHQENIDNSANEPTSIKKQKLAAAESNTTSDETSQSNESNASDADTLSLQLSQYIDGIRIVESDEFEYTRNEKGEKKKNFAVYEPDRRHLYLYNVQSSNTRRCINCKNVVVKKIGNDDKFRIIGEHECAPMLTADYKVRDKRLQALEKDMLEAERIEQEKREAAPAERIVKFNEWIYGYDSEGRQKAQIIVTEPETNGKYAREYAAINFEMLECIGCSKLTPPGRCIGSVDLHNFSIIVPNYQMHSCEPRRMKEIQDEQILYSKIDDQTKKCTDNDKSKTLSSDDKNMKQSLKIRKRSLASAEIHDTILQKVPRIDNISNNDIENNISMESSSSSRLSSAKTGTSKLKPFMEIIQLT